MCICPKCNHTSEEKINFCPLCGAQMSEEQPIQETSAEAVENVVVESAQNAYEQNYNPTYEQTYNPNNYAYPPVKKPSLAFKIVGMGLSIGGFVLSIITAIYSTVALVEPPASFVVAFILSIFYLPFSIVGFVFSNKCINAGDTSTFSRLGKIFGLIGIIIYAASLFIGFLALLTSEVFYY